MTRPGHWCGNFLRRLFNGCPINVAYGLSSGTWPRRWRPSHCLPLPLRKALPQCPRRRRVYECVRLYLLDIEYALAPGGHLRGIGRWACRIGVAVGLAALGLAAVLVCVSAILAVVVVIVSQVVALLEYVLHALFLLILIVVVVGVLLGGRAGAGGRGNESHQTLATPPTSLAPSLHHTDKHGFSGPRFVLLRPQSAVGLGGAGAGLGARRDEGEFSF